MLYYNDINNGALAVQFKITWSNEDIKMFWVAEFNILVENRGKAHESKPHCYLRAEDEGQWLG